MLDIIHLWVYNKGTNTEEDKEMTKTYFINGWRYGESYFKSFGFSESEYERMISGETIIRGENEFWIEIA